MTSLIQQISSFSSEEEYRTYPALNYSRLARFFREGYRGLYQEPEQTPAMLFGTLVDSLTTTNDPFHEEFHNRFFVYPEDFSPPSPAAHEAVKMIADFSAESELPLVEESMILRGLDEAKYHTSWKDYTRLRKFLEEASVDYSLLKQSQGKKIVPATLFGEAIRTSSAVRQHPLVARFLSSDRYSVHYQVKLRSWWPGLASEVKCMLDAVVVDQGNHLIIPCDLKTTGKDEQDFPESIMKWNYWLQAMMYSDILRTRVNQAESGWTILPFYFVVASHPEPHPMVYRFDTDGVTRDFFPSWVEIARKAEKYLLAPERNVPFGMSREMSNKLVFNNKYVLSNKSF